MTGPIIISSVYWVAVKQVHWYYIRDADVVNVVLCWPETSKQLNIVAYVWTSLTVVLIPITIGVLHIIPGRGSHSVNQQAKIKPKVIAYLKEKNYR